MLMRTFPIKRIPRLYHLSRVAVAGVALTVIAPVARSAADDGDATQAQSDHNDEGDKTSSDKKKQEQDKNKQAKQDHAKHGDAHDTSAHAADKQKRGKTEQMRSSQHEDGETPALGVMVASCPGNAVCVKDVIPGSPADSAGLQEGDYILAINEEQVASPERLRDVVEQMKAKDKVTLRVWRQGEEMTEDVTLASKADRPPESHRAWLGVMLMENESEGLAIARVLPGSPAAEAGLEEGDVLKKINDKEVKDAGSFLECIEDMGPEADVSLVIDRDGEQENIKAKLGDVDEAPMAFLREAMRNSIQAEDSDAWNSSEMPPMVEDTLDEMRGRIRSLENQVKELKDGDDKEHSGNASLSPEPVDQLANNDDGAAQETLVVQRGRSRYYNRGTAFSPNYRGNYYSRTPYRSGYRGGYPSNYRSPGSGYSYYRYGGRPYYYGGYGRPYGYGFRSGIQIGRNFGIYW